MTRRKFKVGDRVRIVNYGGTTNVGGEGTVVSRDTEFTFVDLDGPSGQFPHEYRGIPCEPTELESV